MTPPKTPKTQAEPIAPAIPDSALVTAFKATRRASVPIVAIETPDPAATVLSIRRVLNGAPTLSWDCVRGLRGLNEAGKSAYGKLGIQQPEITVSAAETLLACAGDEPMAGLPEMSVLFMHNFHRQLGDAANAQALWNVRDGFELNKRQVVLLGPSFSLPAELAGDVIVLDEPLPTREELGAVIGKAYGDPALPADVKRPDEDTVKAALDAIVGLPNFTAKQVVSMSMKKVGLDVRGLWDRKIKAIENTEGLRVWRGTDSSLDDLKGIDNVVDFFRKLIAAEAFNTIVFIDEGDKAFAGGMSEHSGDSGVSKDQVGQVLTYIEDHKALGVLLAGVAGCGKTELAKAVAAESGKPLIIFDMGGMKGGEVGLSEQRIRAALKVVSATAEGRVLFVMTANKTTLFTPELNRRFPDQFFFDVPDSAGRAAIWPVYTKRFGLRTSQGAVPDGFDDGWTGAEIRRACDRAALFGCSVVEAARFIIPMVISQKRDIEKLRREAEGRFLSASYPGFYKGPAVGGEVVPVASQRTVEVD